MKKLTTDKEIIEMLFQRNEQAISAIQARYGALYRTVISRFLVRKQDLEECEDDLLLEIWKSIPPERPVYFSAFISKIAKNLAIKKYDFENAKKRKFDYVSSLEELEECIPDSRLVEHEIEAKELTRLINLFLKKCAKKNRVIFVKRYWFNEEIEEISRELSLSEGNVRVRLHRTREALKKYLEKEGIDI